MYKSIRGKHNEGHLEKENIILTPRKRRRKREKRKKERKKRREKKEIKEKDLGSI